MLAWFVNLYRAFLAWFIPRGKVLVRNGDTLQSTLPKYDFILMKDDGEDWSVGFRCPCGCGDAVELLLLPNVRPRWDIKINSSGYPTLTPSVWRTTGCRSHFWVRDGRILWVNEG